MPSHLIHLIHTTSSTASIYVQNLLLALDQLGNAILAGDPHETISSRLGRIKAAHHGRIPWTRPLSKLTARVLNGIAHNHTTKAIQPHRGRLGIFDRPPKPPRIYTRYKPEGDDP